MKIRVYCEVLEQGEFFKKAISVNKETVDIILLKGGEINKYIDKSLVSSLYSIKNFDLMVTIVQEKKEIPLLAVEFSTAVQTDDHELQRADILKWSGKFKIPYLKISPLNKLSLTAGNAHGGGNLITIFDQKALSYLNEGIMFHIPWPLKENNYSTDNHKDYPSCPKNIRSIQNLLSNLITSFQKSKDRFEYINILRQQQKEEFKNISKENYPIELLSRFSQSTRIKYDIKKKVLSIKINRYGHGMDPEKGILSFWKLALPNDWVICAEFQVERERLEGRLSYKSNFEGTPLWRNEEKQKVISALKYDKKLTPEQMIEFHSIASASKDMKYKLVRPREYRIDDASLVDFLNKGKLFTSYKGILYYSDQIKLLDRNLNPIVNIKWEKSIVDNHFDIGSYDPLIHLTPLDLEEVDFNSAGEDIITWITKKILEKNNYEILAISYPGAQGDKPILYGPSGVSVRRMYVDIIAYKRESEELLLIESKNSLNNSLNDVEKLSSIITNYTTQLKIFLESVSCKLDNLHLLKVGVVGRSSNKKQNFSAADFVISMELNKNKIALNLYGIELHSTTFKIEDIPALKIK